MDDATPAELLKRLERARRAQHEAEAVAEKVTSDLYAAVQELKALNQTLRDFVSIASHDLQTPVTAIVGFTTLLKDRWDTLGDHDRREFLSAIDRNAGQLTRLVVDLLTVSRIEAGAVDTHAEAVAVRRVTELAMLDFAERAAETRVAIDDGIIVVADPSHIQRILTNYLTNAFKYGRPPVHVAATTIDGWVEIRVCDNGDGVPEDFVPRLFSKFARANAARSERGSGLGLSIVRGLAQANGGDAWYEPNRPAGSCFGVRLPAT